MVSRRKQTSLPSEQPVRFYKIIALTFLFLTVLLFGAVIFLSSQRAVITLETKATPVDINHDIVVGDNVDNPQLGAIVTTTVVTAQEALSPTGDKQEPGVAVGTVTLHNETGAAQALVATTRLLTASNVLFRLKSGVSVPANGTVQAEVYADKAGETGDIGPSKFTIPGLAESKQTVIYATSEKAMSGGVKKIGILSQADVDEAEKKLSATVESEVRKQLATLSNGKEMIVSVLGVDKKTDVKVGETVSRGVLEGKAQVAVVIYDKTELKEWAEKSIQNRALGDTQIVRSSNGEPTVTLKEYAADKNQATLHVFSAGTATVNPESKQLEKSIFFGKTRDEVKRYVMSLEHVSNVKVEFHPFWMQTVPHIHDHVKIIVTEVK